MFQELGIGHFSSEHPNTSHSSPALRPWRRSLSTVGYEAVPVVALGVWLWTDTAFFSPTSGGIVSALTPPVVQQGRHEGALTGTIDEGTSDEWRSTRCDGEGGGARGRPATGLPRAARWRGPASDRTWPGRGSRTAESLHIPEELRRVVPQQRVWLPASRPRPLHGHVLERSVLGHTGTPLSLDTVDAFFASVRNARHAGFASLITPHGRATAAKR